jgi:uncharacterized protein (TIGR03437 family)
VKRILCNYVQLLAVPLFLFGSVTALRAQNTLTVTPGAIFLPSATPGGVSVSQSVAVTSGPVATIPFASSFTTPAPWLTVTPSTGNTPATVTITGNPAGLGVGIYSTGLQMTSPNANGTTPVVVLPVNNPTTLASAPSNLVFQYTLGNPLPTAQNLTISNAGAATPPFGVSALNAPWLLLGQSGNTITVAINPAGLTPNTANVGGIQIIPTAGASPLIVPVVLYYNGAPNVSVSPTSLNFNYQIGATNNIVQKNLSVSPNTATFTATATVPSGIPQWLTVNPTSGTGNITVSVLPAGLPVGAYQGTVTIAEPGANTVTVPVTLNVGAQTLLDVNVNSLSYTYQVGNPNPPDQTLFPTSTTPGLPYTVAASSQGNWLTVNVVNAITPSAVTVSVNPAGLPASTYSGQIAFNGVGAGNNPQTVSVLLTVTNNPTLSANPNPIIFNYEIGQAIPAAQTISVTSGGTPLGFTITANGTSNNVSWLLSGSASATSTPASFTVAVNPGNLPAGVYNGTIALASPGTQLTIPVTLNVSNTALLNLPANLSFTSTLGTSTGPSQLVNVTSTGEAVTYAVTASTISPAGSNWLVVGAVSGPASSTTPSTFIVGVNPAGLNAGSYKGSLLFHSNNGNPDVTVPVTYTITAGNMTVTPATLNFTQSAGGPAPQAQTISVSSTGVQLNFAALSTVSTTTNWLSVTPTAGITPGTIAVSVNAAGLQPGNYTGTVAITSPSAGNSPQSVTVNLTVAQAQNLTLSPASLSFSSQVGAPAPATQTVGVTVSNGNLPFTAAASVAANTPGWLSVSPSSGTANQSAANLTVTVNPQGLNAGTYNGTITVAAQGAGNTPQTVAVTYTVTAIPTPTITFVRNAASNAIMPISPGEIISIFGTNLGPATAVTTNTSVDFPTTLSETQVVFDNIPGAMWYTSATQINVVVPYEIAGRASTLMQVLYKNTPSSTLNLQIAVAAPGIFTNQSGQVAAFNQVGTINGPSNPAPKGSILQMFATGEGITTPAGVTGKIIPPDPNQLKHPVAPVAVTVGGVPAVVNYAGSAPGLVSGSFQINVTIPDNAPSGNAVPIVLTVGSVNNQGTATAAIQ